ncbi:hypothetical protein V493_04006 [Pseudogymnoascus sp. VKM F-4281 (FW-2241)]|nr:hypothetical protein V493_04006 [Pseudogymnoascus sp. VKM F-4281 (FW-2241)]
MVKHSWRAYFRRQEETSVLAQRLCTTDKQLPKYSEIQDQDQDDKTIGQYHNAEKLKVDRNTEIKKGKVDQHIKTEKTGLNQPTRMTKEDFLIECSKHDKSHLNLTLLRRLDVETDEYLEKLGNSDLVELLDIARDTASKPYKPPTLAGLLDAARSESFKKLAIESYELPQCVPLSIPIERLLHLDKVELLYIAQIKPYQKIPKSELIRLSNLDLIYLLREARKEYHESNSRPNKKQCVQKNKRSLRRLLGKKKTSFKLGDMSTKQPSKSESELSRFEQMLEKFKLETNNSIDDRLSNIEKEVATMKTYLVEGRCIGCGPVAVESDIDTDSCTDSTKEADSSNQVEQKDMPRRQAQDQAVQDIEAILNKSSKLYSMLEILRDVEQNSPHDSKDLDYLKIESLGLTGDITDLIWRLQADGINAICRKA